MKALCLLMLFGLTACGGTSSDTESSGSTLVVGSTAAEYGLLTIPRGGGPADLRSLAEPDSILWSGNTELPVVVDARVLDGHTVVLLAEDGRVSRFDLMADELTEIARVSIRSRFAGGSGSAVALIDDSTNQVLRIGPDIVAETQIEAPLSWASPVQGGLVVLIASQPPVLRILRDGETEPVLEQEVGGLSGLVTVWGQMVVVEGSSNSLEMYATDDGSLTQTVRLDGAVRTIAASPSTHEIYIGTDDPPRLVRANRINASRRNIGDFREPLEHLRPSLFGATILVAAADGIGTIAPGDPVWQPLPGSWRSDLPLGLPEGRVIVLVDDEARLIDHAVDGARILAGGAPAWWLPVRWTPRPARPPVPGVVAGETMQEAGDSVSAPAEPPPDQSGHYAIVASASQSEGVRALLASLRGSGYRTRLQEFADEAGRVWYRGLVGPYPTRARAQAAAQQLGRERNLQAWVTEVRDDQ